MIRSHLPDLGTSEEELEEYMKVSPELQKFEDITEHPFYHSTPCKIFNKVSRLIMTAGLDQAKVFTNSVELEKGLPKKLEASNSQNLLPNLDVLTRNILYETHISDATQKKLPRNVAVPNINWNPVRDRMHRSLPYPDGDFSWGRSVRLEYGIPKSRKR